MFSSQSLNSVIIVKKINKKQPVGAEPLTVKIFLGGERQTHLTSFNYSFYLKVLPGKLLNLFVKTKQNNFHVVWQVLNDSTLVHNIINGYGYGVQHHFQQYFSYIMSHNIINVTR